MVFGNLQQKIQMKIVAITGVLLDEKDDEVGVKGVGKDTVAEYMFDDLQFTHDVEFASLAGPLKDSMSKLYNIARSKYDTPEYKEQPIGTLDDWSYRRILECYGTDVIREGVKKVLPELAVDCRQIWLNKICNYIQRENLEPTERLVADTFDISNYEMFEIPRNVVIPRLKCSFNQLHRAVIAKMVECKMPVPNREKTWEKMLIITDVRFLNEYTALKNVGATVIQVRRKNVKAVKTDHPSNQVNPEMVPDYVIQNMGTLFELQERVREVMKNMKLCVD